MNQWGGHVFGIEIGSRGYVAKSLGFAMRKLGLSQTSIRSLRKMVSLICLRSSYLIYLSRKNKIWRPWDAKPHPLKKQSVALLDGNNLDETGDFEGFLQSEIRGAANLNKKKCSLLRPKVESVLGSFEGFSESEIREAANLDKKKCSLLRPRVEPALGPSVTEVKTAKLVNVRRTSDSRRTAGNSSINHVTKGRKVGLLNIGNTCYLNSVMQCLSSVTAFAAYFNDGEYCGDVDPRSKHGGVFAKEVGATLELMNKGCSPVSLHKLKAVVGELHHPFKGSMQQDSHEFLLLMLNWLREDLGSDASLVPLMDNAETNRLDSMIQGINQYSITCSACLCEYISCEPFTIMSLSLPSSGRCTLEGLLKDAYKTTYIDYKCPQCSTQGKCTRRSEIKKLPSVLIFHLKRFDNSSRKKENEIEFPLANLCLSVHTIQSTNNVASFNLCSVTNHYGTLAGGHYTSTCKSSEGDTWYKCNDKNVTKTRMSSISNAAYMLFYELSISGNGVSAST